MAGPKDHRYVRPRKPKDRCQSRGHDQAWAELSGAHNIVCFDCRCCFICTAETCQARKRPGHPEESSSLAGDKDEHSRVAVAGAVGERAESGSAGMQTPPPGEPERAPAALEGAVA